MSKEDTLKKEVSRQADMIKEGTVEVFPEDELYEKIRKSLSTNTPLRIKQGIDPTAPDVHIGHMVPFRKMRQCQDLGHIGVIIIGDYTARIGDPTGRNKERPSLSEKQIKGNAEYYTDQIFKIVDKNRTEIHYQSSWFDTFDLRKVIKIISKFSLAQMMAHETFRKRMDQGKRLSLHELLYPVLQAYDSIQIKADVEIGGKDQIFNILCGRDLMREYKMEPQVVLCLPLLLGNDGKKMSKSLGNYIPVYCPPTDMFGKVMSIPDSLIPDYYTYATDTSLTQIKDIKEKLANNEVNPRYLKSQLAKMIVAIYHSIEQAEMAEKEFERVFVNKKYPKNIPEHVIKTEKIWICQVMKESNLVFSTSEAQRLIKQGAVSIDGEKVNDPRFMIEMKGSPELVIKAGKRRFVKVIYRSD